MRTERPKPLSPKIRESPFAKRSGGAIYTNFAKKRPSLPYFPKGSNGGGRRDENYTVASTTANSELVRKRTTTTHIDQLARCK